MVHTRKAQSTKETGERAGSYLLRVCTFNLLFELFTSVGAKQVEVNTRRYFSKTCIQVLFG